MTFYKSALYTGLSTLLKLLNALFLSKIVSYYFGPEGLARTGQFISFLSFVVLFSSFGINQGVIKYVSMFKNDDKKLQIILGSAQCLISTFSLISFLLLILFKNNISFLLFGSKNYDWLIVILSFCQIFISFNAFFVAILNGLMDFKRISFVNIFGVLVGFLISIILFYFFKFNGILMAYIVSQSLFIVFSSYFLFKIKKIQKFIFNFDITKEQFKNLLQFSFMSFCSAAFSISSQMIIRFFLSDKLSWNEVGYWEGVTKISDAYLLFLTTILSVYCVPKFSSSIKKEEIMTELFSVSKIIIPFTCCSAFLIFTLRDFLIVALFSDQFIPMRDLFQWQLVGDFFRVVGMIFSYFLLSKAKTKIFTAIELICSACFVSLSLNFVTHFGTKGVLYAFCLNTLLFVCLSGFFALKEIYWSPKICSEKE